MIKPDLCGHPLAIKQHDSVDLHSFFQRETKVHFREKRKKEPV